MQIKIPEIKLRKVELPKIDLPKIDLPKVDLPKVDLPKVDVSNVEFKRPEFDLPDLSKLSLGDAGRVVGDVRDALSDRIDSVGNWRKPKRQEGAYLPAGLALLGGLGAGMGLMYFFDPEQGRTRRSLLRDRFTKLSNTASRQARGTAKQVTDRSRGLATTAGSTLSKVRSGGDEGQQGGDVLVAQTPDVSQQLASTDQGTSQAGTAGTWSETSPEVYGQPWGDTGTPGYTPSPVSGYSDPQYQEAARAEAWDPTVLTADAQDGPFTESDQSDENVRIRLSSEG